MARRPIDFKAICSRIQPLAVLRSFGWRPSAVGVHDARGPCPWHHSRKASSRSLQVSTGYAYCHKCKRGGDSVGLFAFYKNLGMYEAAEQLCAAFNVPVPYLDRPQYSKAGWPAPNDPEATIPNQAGDDQAGAGDDDQAGDESAVARFRAHGGGG